MLQINTTDTLIETESIMQDINLFDIPEFCSLNSVSENVYEQHEIDLYQTASNHSALDDITFSKIISRTQWSIFKNQLMYTECPIPTFIRITEYVPKSQ